MGALVLWEVSRKQDYIFSSNKLKENKGASAIIKEVVEDLPGTIDPKYQKNLIYHGGGSSLYIFDGRQEAESFIKKVSTEIIRDYPGIEVFMTIEDYDCKADKATNAISNAHKKLAIKKSQRICSGAQISFGIERRCEATGLPASYIYRQGDERRYISREVKIKLDKSANRFDYLLPARKFINEFSDVAKGEKKYMAVVHIDGNRMGSRFRELENHFKYVDGHYERVNEEYLNALRVFSTGVRNAYESAFRHMCEVIYRNITRLEEDTYIKEGKFPVIPIIIAGDDITYITNGKIGIETAKVFIEYLNSTEISIYQDRKIKLNACAGVAIVKDTYPFSKAYELAEDLCSNAKRRILEDYDDGDNDFSLIDWHIEQGDLLGSIKDVREENYVSLDNKKLYMRPLYLNNPNKWNSYSNFKEAFVNITKRRIDNKTIARNKLKNLRDVLRKGERDTEIYLKSNKIFNYFSRFKDTLGDYCFYEDTCMYYDAIELMDLFVELDTEEVK